MGQRLESTKEKNKCPEFRNAPFGREMTIYGIAKMGGRDWRESRLPNKVLHFGRERLGANPREGGGYFTSFLIDISEGSNLIPHGGF